MHAIELTGMIVVDEQPAPERGVAKRDTVDEQEGGRKRATHGGRSYGIARPGLEVPLTIGIFTCLLVKIAGSVGGLGAWLPGRAVTSGAQIPYRWRGHGTIEGSQVSRVWALLPVLPDSRLRVLLRPPRGRLRLRGHRLADQPRKDRGGAAQHLALRAAPAAEHSGRRDPRRPGGGLHSAAAGAEGAGRQGAVGEERLGVPSHLVLQGPRGRRGHRQGQGVRLRHGGLRLHGQSGQLRRRALGRGSTQVLHLHSRGPRARQDHHHAHICADPRCRGRHL